MELTSPGNIPGPRQTSQRLYIQYTLALFCVWLVTFRITGEVASGLNSSTLVSVLDAHIPFYTTFIWGYVLAYVYPFLPLFFLHDKHQYNQTLLAVICASSSAYLVYLLFPLRLDHPPTDSSLAAAALQLLWRLDFQPGANKLPSLHVAISVLVFNYSIRQPIATSLKLIMGAALALITVSTVFVRQHYVLDVIAGMAWAYGAWKISLWLYQRWRLADTAPATALRRLPRKLYRAGIVYLVIWLTIAVLGNSASLPP